jgi:hypothetical protein
LSPPCPNRKRRNLAPRLRAASAVRGLHGSGRDSAPRYVRVQGGEEAGTRTLEGFGRRGGGPRPRSTRPAGGGASFPPGRRPRPHPAPPPTGADARLRRGAGAAELGARPPRRAPIAGGRGGTYRR